MRCTRILQQGGYDEVDCPFIFVLMFMQGAHKLLED